jgi:hypothetical protein
MGLCWPLYGDRSGFSVSGRVTALVTMLQGATKGCGLPQTIGAPFLWRISLVGIDRLVFMPLILGQS